METITKIGRYRIESWLASGAMGDVYRAHDPVIDRPVAIKVLRRDRIGDGEFASWLERFRREAQSAGRCVHPNIVTILDFGEEGGTAFLAMEYVEGSTLENLLKQEGRLEPRRGVRIMLQVLDALGFAHAHGVIHRDVKPSNIMVLENEHVKVADFGIARIESSEMTIVGDVLGTPAYMAPEQLWGAPIDHRADLFAAGLVLFETLTGVKPFRGKSITEMISHMQTRGPEDILAHIPEAPPELKSILARALAFNPDQRIANAAEFSRALAEAPLPGSGPASAPRRAEEATSVPGPAAPGLAPPMTESSPGAQLLAEIERDLVRLIGPLARIAVLRAARSTSGLAQLHQRLATYIENESDRLGFVARGEARVRAAQPVAGAEPLSAPRPPPAPSSGDLVASIGPDKLSQIEASLTRFIGPIARVLVRQQLSKSASANDFYRELASHIPDDADRATFLASRPSA